MGGSGCGKTLMLRALAGRPLDPRHFKATGKISLNDGTYYRSAVWHRRIGFVQRSDELYPKLTVRETVRFAGQLKAGPGHFDEDEMLRKWGLERIADTLVDQTDNEIFSIGNRKRVAIAVHTVHGPDVLFLDEPSAGLDPRREEQLMADLFAYAQGHQVAIVITLNPYSSSIFRFFPKIMLLCHGQTVYFGPFQDAFWYFERALARPLRRRQSPAEYLTELITIEIDPAIEDSHAALDALREELRGKWMIWKDLFISAAPADYPSRITPSGSSPFWPNSRLGELKILLVREFIEQSRDYPPVIYNILQRVLVFTLLSFLYFQVGSYPIRYAFRVRFGLLIFLPVNQATLVLALIVPSMAYIRPMIIRERLALTYRCSSMYAARVLSEFPVNFITTIMYAFIIYYVTGLRPGFGHFCVFLGTLLLEVFCVLGLGFAVSCAATNRRLRDLLTMIVFLTMFMFGGYQIQNRLNVTWILLWMQYLSPIFYAYSAFIRNEFEDRVIKGGAGNGILSEYRADRISIAAAMGALGGLGSVFFVLGYVALRLNTAPKRFIF
jgi:ATP-binding cassette subfamily G (WHITE) protein 2